MLQSVCKRLCNDSMSCCTGYLESSVLLLVTCERPCWLAEARRLLLLPDIEDILQALADMHSTTAHRDLKPGNVMLTLTPAGGVDIEIIDWATSCAVVGGEQWPALCVHIADLTFAILQTLQQLCTHHMLVLPLMMHDAMTQ